MNQTVRHKVHMESYSQFQTILYKWIASVASLTGHDLFGKRLRPTFYQFITILTGCMFPILYIWTIYKYDGDLRLCAITYFGAAIQVMTKKLFTVIHKQQLQDSVLFLTNVYEVNTKTHENRHLFISFTRMLAVCIRALLIVAIFVYVIYVTSPGLLYLIDSSHVEPILPWVLPGTSPGSENVQDYLINFIYCGFAIFCAVDAYILFALLFTFLLLHVALLTDIMRNKLCLISSRDLSHIDTSINLRNIVLMHNEVTAFIAQLKATYFYSVAIIIFFTSAFVGVRLFAIFVMKSVPLSTYLMVIWEIFELGYFCGLCTIIDINNDRFYNDLVTYNWYTLPKTCRQPYIILLDCAKKTNNFKVANMMPLNMNTYIILNNRIYSFTMVLRNLLTQ